MARELEIEVDYMLLVGVNDDGLRRLRDEANRFKQGYAALEEENAKLRELARDLHMAYIETLNECESVNEGLIWEYSGSIEDDVAKSKAKFEVNRHRFDAALCELGVEVGVEEDE